MRPPYLFALVALVALPLWACSSKPTSGDVECTVDGQCPSGLQCFANWRCYPPGFDAPCRPACYGSESICDKRTLRCVECLADTDCLTGFVCASPNQRCQRGCSVVHPTCSQATERCDLDMGACRGCLVDAECGDPANPRCQSDIGRCVPCLPENDNCSQGKYCAAVAGTFACLPGVCRIDADCTPDGGTESAQCCNHQCVHIATDSNNCGGCGIACRSNKSCCGGLCVDLSSDEENCGACGVSCDRPNVLSPVCNAAQCSNSGCESYFSDCDRDPSNGCETNLTQDPKNCYSCGSACGAFPNTLAACSVAGCTIGPCLTGFGNCNGADYDGCETNLQTDANHCGNCRTACPAGHACVAGQCR